MFTYNMQTKVVFGAGAAKNLTTETDSNSKIMLVTDGNLLKAGVADAVLGLLNRDNTVVFDNVAPNPLTTGVNEAATLASENNVDTVIALGGGSVIDTAKAAAALIDNSYKEIEPFLHGEAKLDSRKTRLIVIPTTAGTGSEVTPISVLTDPVKDIKLPLVAQCIYPDLALVDPEITVSLPPSLTASTGVDALSHAFEALWSTGRNPVSDALALDASERILRNIEQAYANGSDVKARFEMSVASTIAGIAFGQTKTAGVHAVSFPLTHHHGIPHGVACGMTLLPFTELNIADAEVRRKMERLAANLGLDGIDGLLKKMENTLKAIGVKMALSESNVTEKDWLPIIEESLVHPNMGNNPIKMDEQKLREMFSDMENKYAAQGI